MQTPNTPTNNPQFPKFSHLASSFALAVALSLTPQGNLQAKEPVKQAQKMTKEQYIAMMKKRTEEEKVKLADADKRLAKAEADLNKTNEELAKAEAENKLAKEKADASKTILVASIY